MAKAKAATTAAATKETPLQEEDALPLPAPGETTIRDLLSYRLHFTANAVSRSAMIRYRDDFGVSLGEWRTIAFLAATPGMSLNDLVKQASLDKGQMSRIVSSLTQQGYVERDDSTHAGRTIALSLTRKGKAIYRQMIDVARQRDEAFMACLTEVEKVSLFSAMEKLNILAKAMYSPYSKPPAARARKSVAKSSDEIS